MSSAVRLLRRAGFREPHCLVVHPVFAPGAVEGLREAGAAEVVSCNTIPHPTNGIDVGGPIAAAVAGLLAPEAATTR
jgi:ribose-phosphate pyrophosphokinase